MSERPKNGSVSSFFNRAPSAAVNRGPSSPKPPASQPFSSPLVLRSTPKKPARTLAREIKASDDESDSSRSDDSFADLSTLLGQSINKSKRSTPAGSLHNNPFTPRAKRTAVELLASPVPLKHKFDLKALAKDAKRDNATTASSQRKQAADEVHLQEDTETREGKRRSTALVDIVTAKGGHDASKVLRAVKRTDASQKNEAFFFFRHEWTAPPPSTPPKDLQDTPWRIIARGNLRAREQHLVSGLAYTLSLRLDDGFPDDLFEWMVDEVCTSGSSLLREEYSNLVSTSSNQIRILITPQRLQDLFEKVGANQDIRDYNFGIKSVRAGKELYGNRDWSHLKSLLTLLAIIANDLHPDSIMYAATTLVRMSMDRVIISNMDLTALYGNAIAQLVNALPCSLWNNFCLGVGSMICDNITMNRIRINAVLCLPTSDSRTHNLRQRLATAFIMGDPNVCKREPRRLITISRSLALVQEDQFRVSPHTDFAELKASMLLLDVAIFDGSSGRPLQPEEEKVFNEEIDELALKLREIWKRINDSGMKLTRTEAKSVIEWVQQRMTYSVRTKRRLKPSVFDMPKIREDLSLPQQQDYMKNFLKKASAA